MKTITANRLTDGRVVYRTRDENWATQIDAAIRLADADIDAALARAAGDELSVVGPYLIEIEDNTPAGLKWRRETLRLNGPSAGSTRAFAKAS
ncbi:DUF2849 domain-containing protein [Maricaulis sp. CAU 1757]